MSGKERLAGCRQIHLRAKKSGRPDSQLTRSLEMSCDVEILKLMAWFKSVDLKVAVFGDVQAALECGGLTPL